MSRILLHSCCAPCSGAIIERFVENHEDFAVFFSNSNIATKEEYDLRLNELRRYCDSLGVELIEDVYDHDSWLQAIEGLQDEPERGKRCEKCFKFRLLRSAVYARDNAYSLLTTSLASSRWKNLDQVNAAGVLACEEAKDMGFCESDELACDELACDELKFWEANWRKGGLQERRNAIIREQEFYNQNYCGCEFSMRDR